MRRHPPDFDGELPLDSLRALAPTQIGNLLPAAVPIPVDSNMLLKNIAREVRDAPKPTHIRILAELGVLRLFAGSHVYDEMNEHLSEFMIGQGLDPSVAESIWRGGFLPAVRFVDTTQFPLSDPRVLAVRDRDTDDLPTAILACLLGIKALSEDHDLVDYGLATGRPWLDLVFAAERSAVGQTVTVGAAGGVALTGATIEQGFRGLRRMSSDPTGQKVLWGAAILVILGLIIYLINEPTRRWVAPRARALVSGLKDGGAWTLSGLVKVSVDLAEGRATLRAALVSHVEARDEVTQTARILAGSSRPLSTRDLAALLWNYQRVPAAALAKAGTLLRRNPAFVEVAPGCWELGSHRLTATGDTRSGNYAVSGRGIREHPFDQSPAPMLSSGDATTVDDWPRAMSEH